MSNNTPEALRLARMIEHYNAGVGSQRIVEDYQQAAAELRRLYFENEKLRSAPQPAKPAEQDSPWCMKMNDCKTKCEDCPDEVPQPAEQEPIAPAMAAVIAAMQADPEYAWSWHCNIAMAFVDAGGDYYTANQGAARFMKLLANVEPAHDLPAAPKPRKQPLTDEEIDNTTRKQVDDLLDHIYEYGTAAEGIIERVRAIARAIERAHSIGEHE